MESFSQALIDADVIVYRAGYAAQTYSYEYEQLTADTQLEIKALLKESGIKFEPEKLKRHIHADKPEFACQMAKGVVGDILNNVPAEVYKLFLTSDDKSNFRYEIAKTKKYKANRTQPRPVHYDVIREFLTKKYKAIIVSGKEADDEMATRQMQVEKSIICTIDKDLNMVPGWHYNFVTGDLYETSDPGILTLSEDRRKLKGGGYAWFYAQMLLGDSADNIPGIKGLGAVATYNLLKNCVNEEDFVKVCYNEYKKRGVEERFLEVADLLWMQRYDGDRKSEYLGGLLL